MTRPTRPPFTADPIGLYRSLGYPYREHAANLFGVRSVISQAGAFDDTLGVWWQDEDGTVNAIECRGTTDPSDHFLKHPIDGKRTLILKPGHYDRVFLVRDERGAWQTYKGHPALLQYGYTPFTFFVDEDLDVELDLHGNEVTGWKGVHFHRPFGDSEEIGRDSASCQVPRYMADLHTLVGAVRARLPFVEASGKAFADYTLLTEAQVRDFNGGA